MIVLSGPSGVGKSTLSRMLSEIPGFALSVSATTRPLRPGEVEGVHYYFLSREEFEAKRKAREFIESAEVFDHCYGTPAAPIQRLQKKGIHVVLDIDIQGAAQIRKSRLASLSIFILPPSMEVLEKRLRGRETDREEVIEKRLEKAKYEMSFQDDYDYTVVNSTLETALQEILEIVNKEERRDECRGKSK